MTTTIFLSLLSLYATITGIATEGIKKFLDNVSLSYINSNVIAVTTALIVGCFGTAIYYLQANISFTILNVIYMVLLSLASGLSAMVGYDKIKQVVEDLRGRNL